MLLPVGAFLLLLLPCLLVVVVVAGSHAPKATTCKLLSCSLRLVPPRLCPNPLLTTFCWEDGAAPVAESWTWCRCSVVVVVVPVVPITIQHLVSGSPS